MRHGVGVNVNPVALSHRAGRKGACLINQREESRANFLGGFGANVGDALAKCDQFVRLLIGQFTHNIFLYVEAGRTLRPVQALYLTHANKSIHDANTINPVNWTAVFATERLRRGARQDVHSYRVPRSLISGGFEGEGGCSTPAPANAGVTNSVFRVKRENVRWATKPGLCEAEVTNSVFVVKWTRKNIFHARIAGPCSSTGGFVYTDRGKSRV